MDSEVECGEPLDECNDRLDPWIARLEHEWLAEEGALRPAPHAPSTLSVAQQSDRQAAHDHNVPAAPVAEARCYDIDEAPGDEPANPDLLFCAPAPLTSPPPAEPTVLKTDDAVKSVCDLIDSMCVTTPPQQQHAEERDKSASGDAAAPSPSDTSQERAAVAFETVLPSVSSSCAPQSVESGWASFFAEAIEGVKRDIDFSRKRPKLRLETKENNELEIANLQEIVNSSLDADESFVAQSKGSLMRIALENDFRLCTHSVPLSAKQQRTHSGEIEEVHGVAKHRHAFRIHRTPAGIATPRCPLNFAGAVGSSEAHLPRRKASACSVSKHNLERTRNSLML